MSTLDDIYKLADSMGLIAESFTLDGDWHRVDVRGKKKHKDAGAYCLSEFVLRNGSIVVVGMLSNHVTGIEERCTLQNVDGVSDEDLAEAKRRSRETAEAGKRVKIKLQAETAARAADIWNKLPDSGGSLYLDKKKVKAYGLRFSRGSIVVPACDADEKIWTLQFIKGDGSKRFLTGGAKRGHFHFIKNCPVGTPSLSEIGVVEGYATAASIYQSLSKSISLAVAFDAYNILLVGEALRARYPDSRLIFFADHDIYKGYPQAFICERDLSPSVRLQIDRLARLRPDVAVEVVANDDPRLTDPDKHFNTGVTRSLLAAAAVDGDVVIPRFTSNKEPVK